MGDRAAARPRRTTQLFLSKGKKSSKATFHLNGVLFMLSPIEAAEDSVDLQLLVAGSRIDGGPGGGGVRGHLELWSALVGEQVTDVDQFDAAAFVDEAVRAGLIDALAVSKSHVTRLWTATKQSSAFGRVALRLAHKFTPPQLKDVGDAAISAFFDGRWFDVSPVGASLLVSIFDLLGANEDSASSHLRLAAEAAEVVGEVLELVNEQPLTLENPPTLSHRLKRTAAFFPVA
ncbi:hypothetical protein HDU79_006172 [Rhizoclosmatium sp. JEL0117]|nr:hypothetical protein HDU79_006172 [Rhizoclosmatium sp. JEL0117]